MNKLIPAVMFTLMMLGMTVISHAEGEEWLQQMHSRVDTEYQNIQKAVQKGALTMYDARKIKKELDDIASKINDLKPEGDPGKIKQEEIDRDLAQVAKKIRNDKSEDKVKRE
jgi:hypothetical protein